MKALPRQNVTDRQRYEGEFFTPLPFAEKALEYIEAQLGKNYLQTGQYRLWDMAAGTGNLERSLPAGTLPHCYLSTLYQDDALTLQEQFPDAAQTFRYDYLNDDPALMPPLLAADLHNPKRHWLVLLNPPYATAQNAAVKGKAKTGVAETKIRRQMHAAGLGEVSRELYTQFLYRIQNDFQNRTAVLGLFAPLKYLISRNYQRFREQIFPCRFLSGFIFSSAVFSGTSAANHFPVSFILWNLQQRQPLESQTIVLDVYNESAEKIGTKQLRWANRSQLLNGWIKRPRAAILFPPFSSAITVKEGNTDTRNRIAEGFLASLMCPGNELQNQQKTAFLSGPQVSAGAFSVTAENFEQAMTVFAARKIPQNNWLNHVDQLMQPNQELPKEFIGDCTLWSLFDNKNQTAALKDVLYRGKVYQVRNHFFPFPVDKIRQWHVADAAIAATLQTAENTFVADWLAEQSLSVEASAVLSAAETLYRHFYGHLPELPLSKYKIETWDAGWRQISLALPECQTHRFIKEFADLHRCRDALKRKILPQLVRFGIAADGTY
ncbi:MAG: hypothetical protein LBT89_00430 [Planctomycetaceae bacterium]|jgi:hypothetical protein|nr:hypothetical protein [Planctomycetaceae bacterium]